jgi:hypothetical protein
VADYSPLSKLLHRLALSSDARLDALHDLEASLFRRKADHLRENGHVFVCGLARAGTTILMRALYESYEFSSLTYADMPFVIAPNLWARLSGRFALSDRNTQLRAHSDGILVDLDSPEALDEVFWRSKLHSSYISNYSLKHHVPDDETLSAFATFASLVCHQHGRRRYLSKNNNNVLRLPSLAAAFPHFFFLVPIRDPIDQAISLQHQHSRFLGIHQKDKFSRQYMRWLVHHEFGLDHRPFDFGGNEILRTSESGVDYWLEQWIGAYSHLLTCQQCHPENISFVVYEKLCDEGSQTWDALTTKLKLNSVTKPSFRMPSPRVRLSVDEGLEKSAREIYERACRQAL